MNKYIYLIISALLFSACVASKTPEQVKFENEKLLHDLYTLKECRINSIKRLDDGISTVEVIAQAVIKDCSKEAKHVINTNMLDKSEKFREHFSTQMNSVETSGVVGLILKHRQKIDITPAKQTKFKRYKQLIIN